MYSKRKTHKKEKDPEVLYESDETFAFIAGYTSWGVPYGITWEEMSEADENETDENEIGIEELPFD